MLVIIVVIGVDTVMQLTKMDQELTLLIRKGLGYDASYFYLNPEMLLMDCPRELLHCLAGHWEHSLQSSANDALPKMPTCSEYRLAWFPHSVP